MLMTTWESESADSRYSVTANSGRRVAVPGAGIGAGKVLAILPAESRRKAEQSCRCSHRMGPGASKDQV